MKTYKIKYTPIMAHPSRFGVFEKTKHIEEIIINGESEKDARVNFHEGNNGNIVSIAPCLVIVNPNKHWSPCSGNNCKHMSHSVANDELPEYVDSCEKCSPPKAESCRCLCHMSYKELSNMQTTIKDNEKEAEGK